MECHLKENFLGCKLSGAYKAINAIEDAVPIIHGPIGCAHHRVLYENILVNSVLYGGELTHVVCTGLDEEDIIFGAEEKLKKSIQEVEKTFRPRLIAALASCPSGIIGEDFSKVVSQVENKINAKIISIKSEGFSGTQVEGYEATLQALIDEVMKEPEDKNPNSVNILGQWRRQRFPGRGPVGLVKLLSSLGIKVNCVLTGGATVAEIERAPMAELNLLRCETTSIGAARLMERKFGIPFIDRPPIGIEGTKRWAEKALEFLEIEKKDKLEEDVKRAAKEIGEHGRSLKGKTFAIRANQEKAVWLCRFLMDVGMVPVFIGIHCKREEARGYLKDLKNKLENEPVIIHAPQKYEEEQLLSEKKPDIFLGDEDERILSLSMKIPFLNIMRFEYVGFEGAVQLIRDVSAQLKCPLPDFQIPKRF
jgi:nitrogenase molybdenum-cofactor synthesis protein NifE